MVSGATTNYGVHMFRGQTVTEIQETQIDVTGGSSSSGYGIYALGGDWLGSETLELRNVRIKSASSSQAFGILLEANTSVWPDISYSRIEAVSALVTKGIFQGGSPAVVIQSSRISGLTKAVETTTASFLIQSSALFGGPTTGGGGMAAWAYGMRMACSTPRDVLNSYTSRHKNLGPPCRWPPL